MRERDPSADTRDTSSGADIDPVPDERADRAPDNTDEPTRLFYHIRSALLRNPILLVIVGGLFWGIDELVLGGYAKWAVPGLIMAVALALALRRRGETR